MGRDEKIKICHIISGDLWAGAEVQAYTMLKTLAEIPQLDIMAIILNGGKLVTRLRAAGINVEVIEESQNGFFSILAKARECLQNMSIDIVHSHRRKENVLAGLLKGSGHASYAVQTVHGASEPFTGIRLIKEKVYGVMNRYVTNRHFDHIMPVSDDLKTLVSGTLSRGKLTTIHNSIDLEAVSPTKDIAQMRQELDLPVDGPIIGSAGRMVPVKGFDVFLRAARMIIDDRPETSFVLAGDGSLSADLTQLAGALGIEKQVKFPGFRDDIADLLNCLDIFVVSSHHEGIPTVVLEAMALGKPVVSTAVGGIREIIENDVSGILVEAGDAGAIAAACEKLLGDRSMSESLGNAARKTVENKFSSTNQARSIAEVYKQLAGLP